MELQIIQNKIYEIRGQKVMLDFDLSYQGQNKFFILVLKSLHDYIKRMFMHPMPLLMGLPVQCVFHLIVN